MKQPYLILSAVLIASFLAVFFILGGNSNFIQASASNNLSGYAWSSNVGWISFNCTNAPDSCGQADYGVNVDMGTGNLSGYAWSSNVGWISFNETSGCPVIAKGGVCQPKLNLLTGKASGWARVLSLTGSPSGGWMSLSGNIPSSCTGTICPLGSGGGSYGAQADQFSGQFSGWSWEPDMVGWVSWSGNANDGSPYGVIGNSLFAPPCSADTWSCTNWTACSGGTQTCLNWTKTFDCPTANNPSPTAPQSCTPVSLPPTCNNNGACDKDLGETSSSCSADCPSGIPGDGSGGSGAGSGAGGIFIKKLREILPF